MIKIFISSRFRETYWFTAEPHDRYNILDDQDHWQRRRADELQIGDLLEARGKISNVVRLSVEGQA